MIVYLQIFGTALIFFGGIALGFYLRGRFEWHQRRHHNQAQLERWRRQANSPRSARKLSRAEGH